MTARLEFTLASADEKQHAALLAAVESFAADRAFPAALRYRMGLVIDELVANILTHGALPGKGMTIRVNVTDGDDAVVIEIDDDGPLFDPTTHPIPFCPEDVAAKVGGMGLCLIRKLAADIAYTRARGRNSTRITLARCAKETACNSRK